MCPIFYSLQGEAFNAADLKLVVGALAGKSRHIHKEILGLRSSPGRRLAQCSAHMIVWIFPLIAKEWTDEAKCTFIHNFNSISYMKIYCSGLECIWKLCVIQQPSDVAEITKLNIKNNKPLIYKKGWKAFSEWGSEIARFIHNQQNPKPARSERLWSLILLLHNQLLANYQQPDRLSNTSEEPLKADPITPKHWLMTQISK